MLSAKTVTAVFGDVFYVEESDRSSGIRVLKSEHGISAGMKVDVYGILDTTPSGERFISASYIAQKGSETLRPIFMPNRNIGGGDWYFNPATGTGQKGVLGGTGLNNIGLLIATTGRVTFVGPNYFYLDDGSSLDDGSGSLGIKVETVGITLPSEGDFVCVTGISSCFKSGANLHRRILATKITK